MKNLYQKLLAFWNSPFNRHMKDVYLFLILLFSFHYIYLFWLRFDFYPFHTQVYELFDWSSALVFRQSAWVMEHIFRIDISTDVKQTIWVTTLDGRSAYVRVTPDCTSLKQWLHWIFLMVLFPGPWKHKLWFIPAGLIVIHFVNVFRIFGLGLSLIPWPMQFDLFHDYVFRPVFYLLIFLMWIVWTEFFAHRKKINSKPH